METATAEALSNSGSCTGAGGGQKKWREETRKRMSEKGTRETVRLILRSRFRGCLRLEVFAIYCCTVVILRYKENESIRCRCCASCRKFAGYSLPTRSSFPLVVVLIAGTESYGSTQLCNRWSSCEEPQPLIALLGTRAMQSLTTPLLGNTSRSVRQKLRGE